MPDLSIPELAALDGKSYAEEVKARLRNDKRWAVLLDPALLPKTSYTLGRIIASIDAQKARVGDTDPAWTLRIDSLRTLVRHRMTALVARDAFAQSGTKETRAWRGFSARLAAALAENDSTALDTLKTPYGGLTAREWLAVREQKEAAR